MTIKNSANAEFFPRLRKKGGWKVSKKRRNIFIICWVCLLVLLIVGIVLTHTGEAKSETLSQAMRDAVLHEENVISIFGIKNVNPACISAFVVSAVLLLAATIIRIFIIPKFKLVPSKFQLLLETAVNFFDDLAKSNSPHKNKFLGGYIFGAGVYIFFGTLFELFGVQATTIHSHQIALPAPLSDINAAIAMGFLSYFVILSGGISANGFKGAFSTLKDFSLPISMSFRLFGALLSGLLVTELVYYTLSLSFVLPVVVAILFTILHALIQTYVLTMLTALFYGEVSEPHIKAKKNKKIKES